MLTSPQYYFTSTVRPINLFMAGYGSGKTRSMGDLSLYFISNFPEIIGLIAANTFSQLTRSTLFRVYQVWEENGVGEYSENNPKGQYVMGKIPPRHFKRSKYRLDDYSNVISFINGAIVFKGTLENYKALDGMEVGWAMLDETKDTRSEALGVIISRLRQHGVYLKENHIMERDKKAGDYSPFSKTITDYPINPLYVFTAPAKEPWLNAFFHISDLRPEDIKPRLFSPPHYYHQVTDHQQIMIASTYTNEKNLPSSYIPSLAESMGKAFVDMFIYSYPFSASGGEFYKDFNREKHVGTCEYDPALPLHITFDENVVPYQPAGVWQTMGKRVRKIAEVPMEPPRNNIFELCKELGVKYGGHKAGVFIYGDATSLKRDSKQRLNENFFTIVRRELYEWKPVMRIPLQNPDVVHRGSFVNAILRDKIFGIDLLIDESCRKSIEDYEFLKEDNEGKKRKEMYTDPLTKVSYQRWGHFSDADDYFLLEYFRHEYNAFLKKAKNKNTEIQESEQMDRILRRMPTRISKKF